MKFAVVSPRLFAAFFGFVFITTTSLSQGQVLTVQVGSPPQPPTVISNLLAAHGDDWYWRRGTNAPQANWMTVADSGLDATWTIAPGGFGYGDNAIVGEATHVDPGMLGVHTTLYIRIPITVPSPLNTNASLILTADYDDGFVAYLDGTEMVRRNVPGMPGTPVSKTATTGGVSHEASCCRL